MHIFYVYRASTILHYVGPDMICKGIMIIMIMQLVQLGGNVQESVGPPEVEGLLY